jgi:hypothetical protein
MRGSPFVALPKCVLVFCMESAGPYGSPAAVPSMTGWAAAMPVVKRNVPIDINEAMTLGTHRLQATGRMSVI